MTSRISVFCHIHTGIPPSTSLPHDTRPPALSFFSLWLLSPLSHILTSPWTRIVIFRHNSGTNLCNLTPGCFMSLFLAQTIYLCGLRHSVPKIQCRSVISWNSYNIVSTLSCRSDLRIRCPNIDHPLVHSLRTFRRYSDDSSILRLSKSHVNKQPLYYIRRRGSADLGNWP